VNHLVPVPVWAIVLVLVAALACAWVVAVVLARMIAAETAADLEERRVSQARRELASIDAALASLAQGLASKCGCGYMDAINGARRRMGDIRSLLRGEVDPWA
jgi:hypothetical protein